ncbi:13171_t:CDS:2, partial [Dentiscutata heterogama]
NLNLNEWDDTAFWAIATTAFYGLARLGGLLPTTQHDQNKTDLKNQPPGPIIRQGRWIMGNETLFHQQAQTSLTIRGCCWPQFQGRWNNRTGHAGSPTRIGTKNRQMELRHFLQ